MFLASTVRDIPLMSVVLRGDLAAFRVLSERIKIEKSRIGTFLCACVSDRGDRFVIFNHLLESYTDVISRDVINEALVGACHHESHRVIELLLSRGGDVNVVIDSPRDAKAPTPLLAAARAGHEDVVRLLMRHGADASLSDQPNISSVERILKSKNKGLRDARAVVILMEILEMPLTDKVCGKTLLTWFDSADAKEVIRNAQRRPRSQAMAESIEAAMGDMDKPPTPIRLSSGPSL
jgi:hypothetical protein